MLAKSGQWFDVSGYQDSKHSIWLANWELRAIWKDLHTGISARYCSRKYPQVRLSNYCFASTYQQIITISSNSTIKGKLKSAMGYGIPRFRKKSNKRNKSEKTRPSNRILSMLFFSLMNSTIPVLWGLFNLCNYPYLAWDIGDWGRAGA